MIKITFMGAGSTVFARNVLGDCICAAQLHHAIGPGRSQYFCRQPLFDGHNRLSETKS